MATFKKHGGILSRIKSSLQRYTIIIMVVLAFLLMLVGKLDILIVEKTKSFIIDITHPLVQLVSYPSQAFSYIIDNIDEFYNLREENKRLRKENETLIEWKNYAQKLEGDIERIAKVVNYIPPPESSFITAKVIADAGTPLSQSVIALAGKQNGIKKGLVAVTNEGVVGRVLYAGQFTSRILLLTDVNSRLPIVIGENKIRALLIGDNDENPSIVFLPIGSEINIGDKILTSGTSGVFPPDLTIGTVASIEEDDIKAELAVDRNTLSFVKIVDYGLEGILPEKDCKVEK